MVSLTFDMAGYHKIAQIADVFKLSKNQNNLWYPDSYILENQLKRPSMYRLPFSG